MYKFKIREIKGALWLRVEGNNVKVWKVYKPSEILDLITELECYDDGSYDRPAPSQRCQCEHTAHGDEGCAMVRQREAKTVYGTFHLCLTCLERGHMGIGLVRVDTPLPAGFNGF